MSFKVVLPKIDIKHKIWYVVQYLILTSRLKTKISHEVYRDLSRAAGSRYCTSQNPGCLVRKEPTKSPF